MKRPEGGQRDGILDVTRGLAAILVVSVHVQPLDALVTPVRAYMWLTPNIVGVTVFFILSGYLVATPWLRGLAGTAPYPVASDYLRRRLLRILPAYWTAVLLAYVIETPAQRVPVGTLLEHLFFYQIYRPHQWTTLLIVSWTLSVEVSFYLLLPLIVLSVRRLRAGRPVPVPTLRRALIGITVADILAYELLLGFVHRIPTDISQTLFQTLAFYVGAFALGALAALSPDAVARLRPLPTVIAAFLSLELCTELSRVARHNLYGLPLVVIPSALFVCTALALRGSGERTAQVIRVLTPLGTFSYGIYLFHLPVLNSLIRWAPGLESHIIPTSSWPTRVVVLLLLTIPVGAFSWYAVESPALRWAARRGEPARAARREEWAASHPQPPRIPAQRLEDRDPAAPLEVATATG